MESLENIELKFRQDTLPNFEGYNYPPEFRPLKISDAPLLAPILRREGKSLSTYLSGFEHSERWTFASAQKFVSAYVNDQQFPSFHYLFLCGPHVVGMGSIMPYAKSPRVCQFVIAVFGAHQGKGWGKVIAKSLKEVAFQVWGFESIYWLNDVTNRASSALARQLGAQLEETYENDHLMGSKASGLWMRWRIDRPEGLPAGILQGAPIEYWATEKTRATLEAVIESQQREQQIS